ncbi:MAG: MotA/TolQ/ExbB proton channel family protein [Polyangiaceae bacterium]
MDINRITSLAEFGAGWVLWLLVALSIVAIAVAIERAVLFLSSRDDIVRLRDELRALLSAGEANAARRKLEESPSFEARVAAAGLLADGSAAAEERIAGETELVRLTMEKNLTVLGTLGNNAPFIGLLGTVIGIVRAFRELEHSSGQVSAGLMSEIGEALVATAVGLVVALPAVAFFNLYQRLIKARLARANALGHEVLAFRKSEALPSAAE